MAQNSNPWQEQNWDEVARLLEGALALAPEQREQFLRENTTDEEIRQEAESLLKASAEGEFLEQRVEVPEELLADPYVGRMVGNCQLVRKLGEGGMGLVYEGVRQLQGSAGAVEQRVAVKFWKQGRFNPQQMQQEAALLARLEHPGIARLLDTGQTEDRQPYLVMELVEGETLLAYAAGRSQEEKLRLMEQICAAVGAAHRALIVHRDLKPSNILVTSEGRSKLIDFGIGKAMEEEGQATEARLTPRYASPEQLRGANITTATDLYSLGVILYELLSGGHPYATGTQGARSSSEILQAMEIGPPPRPEGMPKDLAAVALRAMALRPDERYATAEALAEELRRFRRGEPVMILQEDWLYRGQKFAARRRWPLLFATAALLLVGFAFGRAYWEARKAAQRFEQVRGLARALLFEIHDEVQKVPGTLESRKLILQYGLAYLDQLAADASMDERLQQDLAESYARVGAMQGTLVRERENFGQFRDAAKSHQKALDLLQDLYARQPHNRELRLAVATQAENTAVSCANFDDACEQRNGDLALRLFAEEAAAQPKDMKAQARYLTARISKQNQVITEGRLTEARQELRQVAERFVTLVGEHPEDIWLQRNAAYAYKRLGALEGKLENYRVGEEWYRRAMAIHERLKEPLGVSTCLVDIAWIHGQEKNLTAALENLTAAAELRRELAKGRTNDYSSNSALASALSRRAGVLSAMQQYGRALQDAEEAVGIMRPFLPRASQNKTIAGLYGNAVEEKGHALWALGRKEAARGLYRELVQTSNTDLLRNIDAQSITRMRQRLHLPPLPEPAKPSPSANLASR